MKPWERLATARMPDGASLELHRHDGDYVMRLDNWELMTSRAHGSEDSLLRLACPDPPDDARVLIGGLGMGFTLAAALRELPQHASAVVVELVPEVVDWNRGPLAALAGRPLDDPRTEVIVGDVAAVIEQSCRRFDAILLDVDNGPDSFTQVTNARLYQAAGLAAVGRALRPGGGIAIWSLDGNRSFERRLRSAGFRASIHRVAAHGRRGTRHVVFVGRSEPAR